MITGLIFLSLYLPAMRYSVGNTEKLDMEHLLCAFSYAFVRFGMGFVDYIKDKAYSFFLDGLRVFFHAISGLLQPAFCEHFVAERREERNQY